MDARLDRATLDLLGDALDELDAGFGDLPPLPQAIGPDWRRVLLETADRLRDNDPYFHPLYVGQMLKPPHPVARLAYALALWINPNNHAIDGGRASSAMEKEAVARLAALFGWDTHLGHLCGGGTMANLESLWVAREVAAGGAVLASSEAHYTHRRLSGVLGIPFREVAADERGRMDLAALDHALAQGDVAVVVATIGTTATGAVDPLPKILERCRRAGVRVHADAAYGGFFRLASRLGEEARRAVDALAEVDSLVVDPHKHGLQPYGCGCVLFRDPSVGRVYRHDSPYTYFSSDDLHLGEISLECSRPGAAAVALWATQRLLPYERGGEFAAHLDRCLEGARALAARLERHPRFVPLLEPELDIVVFAVEAATAQAASAAARAVFERAHDERLWLALAKIPARTVATRCPSPAAGGEPVTCLRACVMKPEHADWLDAIMARLDAALAAAG